MRRTEEGEEVKPKELVWEVMYAYKNPEVYGWAYPEQRLADRIPESQPIWKHRSVCAFVCFTINNKNYPTAYLYD